MILRFILSSYRQNLFKKGLNKRLKCFGQCFFKIDFQTKSDFVRIFSRNIYSTNFCQYLLSYFLERKQIPKILLFFNSRLKIFWSRVQPGWKISVRPWEPILRIKSRSTMIVKNWSNKKFPRFFRTKFRSVYVSNLKRQF